MTLHILIDIVGLLAAGAFAAYSYNRGVLDTERRWADSATRYRSYRDGIQRTLEASNADLRRQLRWFTAVAAKRESH